MKFLVGLKYPISFSFFFQIIKPLCWIFKYKRAFLLVHKVSMFETFNIYIYIEVETLATRRAVEFALELGFENIVLERDSEILIKLLNSSSRSLAPFGHIINDIIFLASHFACFSATHVKRHCNRVAHSLARRALSFYHLSVWMEDVPPDLLSIIQADLNSLP